MESDELSILAVTVPVRPDKPSITQTEDNMLEINWEAPASQGDGSIEVSYDVEF